MNNEAQHAIWTAFCDLGDWFSRLGGAAAYPNFHEVDVGILMVVLLKTKSQDPTRWKEAVASQGRSLLSPHHAISEMIPRALLENAEHVLGRVIARLDTLTLSPDVIGEFVGYIDSRLHTGAPARWNNLKVLLNLAPAP